MENDISSQGSTNLSPVSQSRQSANVPKPQRSQQEQLAPYSDNVAPLALRSTHVSFTDANPGSSRNFCQSEISNVEEDTMNDRPSWFVKNQDSLSVHSIDSIVCRICHSSESPQKLVSPCLCKGSLTYVHVHCLERWISMSRCTTCELCQFQYNTEQNLRYSMIQSLRIWYARTMSRRALQEDCQMFSLLTLVAFGIIGTLMVAVQYYILQGHLTGIGRLWTKGWLIFFLFTTLIVYFINVYMIVKSQLTPWYRWWQSARDIRLILENHKPFLCDSNRNQMHSEPNQYQHLPKPSQSSVDTPTVGRAKSLSGLADNDMLCTNSMQQQLRDSSEFTSNRTTAMATIVALADAAVESAVAAKTTSVLDLPISDNANHSSVPSGSPSKSNDDDQNCNDGHDVSTTST